MSDDDLTVPREDLPDLAKYGAKIFVTREWALYRAESRRLVGIKEDSLDRWARESPMPSTSGDSMIYEKTSTPFPAQGTVGDMTDDITTNPEESIFASWPKGWDTAEVFAAIMGHTAIFTVERAACGESVFQWSVYEVEMTSPAPGHTTAHLHRYFDYDDFELAVWYASRQAAAQVKEAIG